MCSQGGHGLASQYTEKIKTTRKEFPRVPTCKLTSWPACTQPYSSLLKINELSTQLTKTIPSLVPQIPSLSTPIIVWFLYCIPIQIIPITECYNISHLKKRKQASLHSSLLPIHFPLTLLNPFPWVFFNIVYLFLLIFRKKGRGEKHRCESVTSTDCLLQGPLLGTEPETMVCALTGSRTGNLLVYGLTPNQLNHTGQGHSCWIFTSTIH